MSGAYAHLTVATLISGDRRLMTEAGFQNDAMKAVMKYKEYACLGAVSPDYPYLALADGGAAEWADAMHYTNTGQLIKNAILAISGSTGEDKLKQLSWLMGFISHVGTDITVHPVVEARVGPYHENQNAHMACEMNQDVYIFPRLNLGSTDVPEYLDATLRQCSVDGNLDPAIAELWLNILNKTHAKLAKGNPPNPLKWHKWFIGFVDAAEETPGLPKFARHVAAHVKPVYPAANELDMSYIENLKTPSGTAHYDEIFERALRVVSHLMKVVSDGVLGVNNDYEIIIKNWNLDNGEDENSDISAWEGQYDV